MYISKYNHERINQIILLMIANDNKNWHYLVVKSFSRLLRRITSNDNKDFYCLNCFHSYSIKERLKKHEKVFKGHDYYVKIPDEDKKNTKVQHRRKVIKSSVYSLCRLRVFA